MHRWNFKFPKNTIFFFRINLHANRHIERQVELTSHLIISPGNLRKLTRNIPCIEYSKDDLFSRKVTSASCSSCQVRHCRSEELFHLCATHSRASLQILRRRSIWTENFNNNVVYGIRYTKIWSKLKYYYSHVFFFNFFLSIVVTFKEV